MRGFSAYKTVLIALLAALICVATMLVQIPLPATGGYVNLGDGIILICAFLMHPLSAVAAAGLGSALADILTGYISFAPGTLLIKAGVALIAALTFNRFRKETSEKKVFAVMIAAGLLAEVFMIVGYFFYEAVILGIGFGAAGGVIGNIGQGIAGVSVSCLIAPALRRSNEIREFMDKTR